MTITEWFDPHNIEHIKAYHHLSETGFWPLNFVPDEIEVEICHQVNIIAKMGTCWVKLIFHQFINTEED